MGKGRISNGKTVVVSTGTGLKTFSSELRYGNQNSHEYLAVPTPF
jgi:hypothetical protein